MDKPLENSEIKILLEKSSEINTSTDFTFNVMQGIESFEAKKIKLSPYFKICFVLMILATALSFYVIIYFSTLSCLVIKTNCQIFQFLFAAIIALVILGQFNYLLTRLKQDKHSLA